MAASPSPPPSLATRKYSLLILFLLPGLGMSSWVTRTPAVRDQIDASTAQMATVLFGLSVGAFLGTISSGPLTSRFGARTVITAGLLLVSVGVPLIGLGAALSTAGLVMAGLALFGLGMGSAEIAMNIEGAGVERELGSTFLTLLHGFFSLGTVIGATAGILLSRGNVAVSAHLAAIGIITLIALIVCIRGVLPATGKRAAAAPGDAPKPQVRDLWKDKILLLIGALVLIMALAEGTANDWLPLIMVDGFAYSETGGAVVFALFATAMTVGRFFGGRFVDRYGRGKVMVASALFALVGLLAVSQVDHEPVVLAAVVLWGLGASLGFPVAVSAAGSSGDNASARVAVASTLGYVAFLVGPPLLGYLGEAVGLRNALFAPAALTLVAAGIALALQRLLHRR